jgi:hypothetical protein
MGFVARLCQPWTLRMLIWPEASSAQNNMAAVSADEVAKAQAVSRRVFNTIGICSEPLPE